MLHISGGRLVWMIEVRTLVITVDILKVKIQHLVSLFTLLSNNLVNACQELSHNSDIKGERMSRL